MTKHAGYNIHRLANDRNPLELAFAREWLEENRSQDILARLLSPTNDPQDTIMTERDTLVAATVIQWLGSHVGQSFVRRVGEGEG